MDLATFWNIWSLKQLDLIYHLGIKIFELEEPTTSSLPMTPICMRLPCKTNYLKWQAIQVTIHYGVDPMIDHE